MTLSFLGGVRGIGASACLLEIEGRHILIDAGIRLNPGPEKKVESFLPKLEKIKELDIILVTHAHMDHIGALPVMSRRFPQVKIICTEATFEIAKIMLINNLSLMKAFVTDGSPMIFDEREYELMVSNIFLVDFSRWFRPFNQSDIRICFRPAGHILGAASILMEGEGKKIMFSGDFTIIDQHTVRGFQHFDWQPDILVMEATYGDAVHPSRKEQVESLGKDVARAIKRGGTVLIPSFAVGRAQEILLTLSHLQSVGLVPDCPIYYDGLVASVCDLYQSFGLFSPGSKRVRRLSPRSKKPRELIAREEPAIIVASAGTLQGGPSLEYALALISHQESAIFFSGYLDEESPGRMLLEAEKNKKFRWQGKEYDIRCELSAYKFSAHADLVQLKHFAFTLSPAAVILNHSNFLTMRKLAKTLRNEIQKEVVIWTPSDRTSFDPLEGELGAHIKSLEVMTNKREWRDYSYGVDNATITERDSGKDRGGGTDSRHPVQKSPAP